MNYNVLICIQPVCNIDRHYGQVTNISEEKKTFSRKISTFYNVKFFNSNLNHFTFLRFDISTINFFLTIFYNFLQFLQFLSVLTILTILTILNSLQQSWNWSQPVLFFYRNIIWEFCWNLQKTENFAIIQKNFLSFFVGRIKPWWI